MTAPAFVHSAFYRFTPLPDAQVAAAALRPGYRTSVRDVDGARTLEPEHVALADPAPPTPPSA